MLKTLSDRLIYAMQFKAISQAELSRKIGVKKQAINYLCKNAKKSLLTYDIAEALSVNYEWLANGTGEMNLETIDTVNNGIKIPIITLEEARKLKDNKEIVFNTEKASLLLEKSEFFDESYFAVRLEDTSMIPRFEKGSILIFSRKKSTKNHDFSLIYINELDDIIFRKIEFSKNDVTFIAFNEKMYKNIKKSENDVILGNLVEARFDINKMVE